MAEKSILIIEDNELNKEILTYILQDTYTVLTAENGEEGLELLNVYGSSVALILLDIHMPVMDGYTFMEEVRRDGKYVDIPIIVTTSSDTNQIRCLEMGASDFVSKPYDPMIVRKRAESLIRLKETSLMLHRVERDSLTRLYTKESFMAYAAKVLKKDPDGCYDMVCMELEAFDQLVNRYGSGNCMSIIKSYGILLQGVMPSDALIGRISESKFAVLMKHIPMNEFQKTLFWCNSIPNMPPLPETKVNIGIYPKLDHEMDVAVIINNAFLSIVQVRGTYDKHIAEFDDAFREKMNREQMIIESAERAIEEKQFVVYYQPKVDARTRKVNGAEALVRWIHPIHGFLSPGEFIPVFEKNGFIQELDKYVLKTVCQDLKKWIRDGRTPVPVSINISQLDFDQSDLDLALEGIVDKSRLPHDLIHFEITESKEATDVWRRNQLVKKIYEKGFAIELDDFGNGYSTLQILGELPVDVVKMDISLVRNMFEARYGAIVEAVLFATERLNCRVVAEGVETMEQFEALKAQCGGKIDLSIQGYLFSKPVPAEEFAAMLNR